jgi:hypothetical protein
MNWQQFLPLAVIVTVATIFVWRGSGDKKPGCGSGSGCSHAKGADAKKTDSAH